jgi:FdhE protein
MNSEARIIEPGQIQPPTGQPRYLIIPEQRPFARRAARFRFLAHGNPLEEYLTFLGHLADAQQTSLDLFPPLSLPHADEQSHCRKHGMPLLPARSWHRDPVWRGGLTAVLHLMGVAKLPPAAHDTVSELMGMNNNRVEKLADSILSGNLNNVPPGQLPFIAAALQVYWVRMASGLGCDVLAKSSETGGCPVCGSPPVAGFVVADGTEKGLRYLCCSLCDTRWNVVRLTCCSCKSSHGISHFILDGADGAVKAESCSACNGYLKLLYLEKDGQMDAIADDLATLTLDMLMDSEQVSRIGPNLLFHPGVGS